VNHGVNRAFRTVRNNRANRYLCRVDRVKMVPKNNAAFASGLTGGNGCVDTQTVTTKWQALPPPGRELAAESSSDKECPFIWDSRAMKRSVVLLALATLVLGTSGCGCCRKKAPAVPTQVYRPCAPVCAPACPPPACNSCSPGGSVTYGYPGASTMMSSPQMYQQMPMTAP